MHLNNLTHDQPDHPMPDPRTRTCQILLRILRISLIIPCRQHHAVCHQTVQWIHHCRRTTNLAEEIQRLNGKNSPFHPQVDSIDWGVMSLCRRSRNHLPSQSQASQPILPTVLVPSPPAILTNPEDLELPTLEQEETTGSPSKKQKTGKKKKKKKPDDNDESPEHSPRNEPASSSNYNPNNPANLPVQYESEEELIPHVPTSSGTGSSERTMRYTDHEDGELEDSQRTRSYDDHQADLVLDEAHWSLMTAEQKICANTALLGRVKGTFNPSPRCGFSH